MHTAFPIDSHQLDKSSHTGRPFESSIGTLKRSRRTPPACRPVCPYWLSFRIFDQTQDEEAALRDIVHTWYPGLIECSCAGTKVQYYCGTMRNFPGFANTSELASQRVSVGMTTARDTDTSAAVGARSKNPRWPLAVLNPTLNS